MRFLAPDELPEEAEQAVELYLADAGTVWTITRAWENGRDPVGYAVTVEHQGQRRALTVLPTDGDGFAVLEVTNR